MTEQDKTTGYTLVVGLGKTGLSVVRHLHALGDRLKVVDTRDIPPGLSELMRCYPEVECVTGAFDDKLFMNAERIIASPGVALSEQAFTVAREHDVPVLGDVDLFIDSVNAPVIAITGSNGKSTVTRLLADMAAEHGLKTVACGNIGLPMLEAIEQDVQLYVVELSSFQLETVQHLPVLASVVLNLSPDHLDRYNTMDDYARSKRVIYRQAEHCVINKDDALAAPGSDGASCSADNTLYFTAGQPSANNEFGLVTEVHGDQQQQYICRGQQKLIATDEISIKGQHNVMNALAALALGSFAGLSIASMTHVLKTFQGLPHRTQLVSTLDHVNWINDSKATNVGAAVAAINGIQGRHVLIAGGIAKEDDFSELAHAAEQKCRAIIVIGRDAELIADAVSDVVAVYRENSMESAVATAASLAQAGDNVLLSPACASFDMYTNFEQRGDAFIRAVRGLAS